METVDFRAPPPSPVDSSRRPSLPNDSGGEVFSEFLRKSLHVPNLSLKANKFQQRTPPKVDFRTLSSSDEHERERGVLRDVMSDSLATIGCFQLLNHGIPPELTASTMEAAVGMFRVPAEKRAAAMGSAEKACESEECDEESEELVWCRDHDFNFEMKPISPTLYSNFSEKMESLLSSIEKVAEKILSVILEDLPKKCGNSDEMSRRGHEVGTLCCVYKHVAAQCAKSFNYDVIKMLTRGTFHSHSLCLHLCYGCSEFYVYSNKASFSFFPEQGAIIITAGDQTKILSDGRYKHVIGRPIFKCYKQESISIAFLYSPANTNTNVHTSRERAISLGQQAILAIILNLVCHFLIFVFKRV